MERRADLHMHTTCSDGKLTPTELVRKAAAAGLGAIALTDHDSVEGLDEARHTGAAVGVDVVTGVEISADVMGRDVHLLGYFFDLENGPLREALAWFARLRRDRAVRIVERLNGLGVPIDVEAVFEEAGAGVPGRPHVAGVLVREGYVATRQEAFDRYLGDDGPAYVPHAAFTARQALDLIHRAGGIVVIAHPGPMPWEATESLIRQGIDGIETVHPSHTPPLVHQYRQIVRRFALIETGGSDYHGNRPEDEERFGRYTISCAELEALRNPS